MNGPIMASTPPAASIEAPVSGTASAIAESIRRITIGIRSRRPWARTNRRTRASSASVASSWVRARSTISRAPSGPPTSSISWSPRSTSAALAGPSRNARTARRSAVRPSAKSRARRVSSTASKSSASSRPGGMAPANPPIMDSVTVSIWTASRTASTSAASSWAASVWAWAVAASGAERTGSRRLRRTVRMAVGGGRAAS